MHWSKPDLESRGRGKWFFSLSSLFWNLKRLARIPHINGIKFLMWCQNCRSCEIVDCLLNTPPFMTRQEINEMYAHNRLCRISLMHRPSVRDQRCVFKRRLQKPYLNDISELVTRSPSQLWIAWSSFSSNLWAIYNLLEIFNTVLYFLAFPNDRVYMKCLVYILEFVQSVLITGTEWRIFVTGFGNVDQVGMTWLTIPILSAIGELSRIRHWRLMF